MGDLSRQRGFTLIEACIVIAVTALVTGAAVPGLQAVLEGRRLSGAATLLATDIQYVRTEALARNRPLRLSFHADGDSACYVIHTGTAAQCTCATEGAALCSEGAEQIKTVHLPASERVGLQANVASVLFDPLHCTSTPAGTLREIGTQGREVRHVINIMGRVRSCSPQGAMPGFKAC